MLVKALAYVVLDSPNLDGWAKFASNVLGLQPLHHAGELLLRIDEWAQRVVIRPAASAALGALGWDVGDQAGLDRLRSALDAAGVPVHSASPADTQRRAVANMIWAVDPDGNRLEFVCGAQRSDAPFTGGARPSSGFVTGELGMGHVVLMAKDQSAMRDFYVRTLGFQVTDHSADEVMVFLRCNARHHSLGLLGVGVSGFNHLMIEAGSIDDVGRAFDALRLTSAQPAVDLGRHGNDGMFSFYAWTPDEHMFEYGADGKHISPDAGPTVALDDLWGHAGLMESHTKVIGQAYARGSK